MKRAINSFVSALILMGLMAPTFGAGQIAMPIGDGVARIGSYNAVTKTVRIGGVDRGLSSEAAVALEGQLAKYGMPANREFGARFVVSKGPGGVPVISKIGVYPPVPR